MLKRSLLTLLILGAGAFGLSAAPASALTVPTQPVMQQDGSSALLVPVEERRMRSNNGVRSGRCVEPNCLGARGGDRSGNRGRVVRNRANDNARVNRDNRDRVVRDNRNNRDRVIRNDNFRRNHFRNNNHIFVYNRNIHGPRCQTRFGNCRYFHRGYYYYSPWWNLSYPGVSVIAGSSYYPNYYDDYADNGYGDYDRRHVEWCLDRYRSYDVRTNSWVSYSGEVRQCRSPYY